MLEKYSKYFQYKSLLQGEMLANKRFFLGGQWILSLIFSNLLWTPYVVCTGRHSYDFRLTHCPLKPTRNHLKTTLKVVLSRGYVNTRNAHVFVNLQ